MSAAHYILSHNEAYMYCVYAIVLKCLAVKHERNRTCCVLKWALNVEFKATRKQVVRFEQ